MNRVLKKLEDFFMNSNRAWSKIKTKLKFFFKTTYLLSGAGSIIFIPEVD